MKASSKLEQIIAITDDYTKELVKAKATYDMTVKAYETSLSFWIMSDSEEPIPEYPEPLTIGDNHLSATTEAILYRIQAVLEIPNEEG